MTDFEMLTDFCCRANLDEAANASYELTDAEYASNEVEDTWVDHLLAILVAMLQWLQPLLTPSNYDTLVASLLQKVTLGALIWQRRSRGHAADGTSQSVLSHYVR